jgi:TolB-like protein/DNA-binding SARP family transcriptional activator/Tfp pilus assembly protein PilF
MKSRARFRVHLLGRFAVFATDNGSAPIRLSTRKSAALLAVLATRLGQIIRREELAALLWGTCSEQQARQSLRQALTSLRKALGDKQLLAADQSTVGLDPAAWSTDLQEFESLAASSDARDLARAGALFGGAFLQDLNIDEEGYGEWLNSERLRVELSVARLCENYANRPDLVLNAEQAIATTERLIALDPLREDRQRIALTLYARYRGKNEVAAQAAAFAGLLKRELGVSPEKDTLDLVERIRAGAFAAIPAKATVEAPASEPPIPSSTAAEAPARSVPARPPRRSSGRWQTTARAAGVAAGVILVVGLAFLGLNGFVLGNVGKSAAPLARTASSDRWRSLDRESDARRLRNLTAVAVLPFSALGENAASAQPIADALTDDLTDTLSRSANLRVISRRTMTTYRGKPVDVAALGAELDVRYVLEGTIQTEGDKLRVNVELVDPATRSPTWSSRVERRVTERGAVRDEIVARLARELTLKIPAIETANASANPDARELILRGWAAIYESGTTPSALRDAETAFSQALARDPQSRGAKIGLGTFHALAAVTWLDGDFASHVDKAEKILLPMAQSSPNGAGEYFGIALVREIRGDVPGAIQAFRHVLEFNPSHAPSYAGIGHVLISSGKAAEGLAFIKYAMRLSPRDAQRSHWLRFAAEAELELKRYDEALSDARQSESLGPGQPQTLRTMAVVLAASGQVDEARGYIAKLRTEFPTITTERIIKRAVMFASGQPEFLRALRLALAAPADSWASPRALTPQATPNARPIIPILVLPFGTSGETSGRLQLTADMITDDLTNSLSRVASFRVISRQTARSLRSQPIDVAALGAELKVQYVLEGSLHLLDDRLRVNVELIDPATRLPVWSGRIERDGADRQGVQDEIVAQLARELQFETLPIESARLSKDFDAGALAYRGWAALSNVDRGGYERALALFEQALAQDPQNLSAQIGIGAYHARMGAQVFDTNSLGHRAKAEQILREAIRRDPQSSDAHFYLGLALNRLPTLPEALEHFARAIEIEPSHASAHAQIGNGLIRSGRVAEGLEHVRYAMRLSPRDPIMPVWLEFAGNAELELKNFPEAIALFRRSAALNPGYPRSWAGLVAAYALAGHDEEARESAKRLKTFSPNLSEDGLVKQYGRHDTSLLAAGLRLALAPSADR